MRDFSHNLRKNFLAGTIFGIFPHFQLFPFSFYPCCEILGFDGSKFYSERISRQKFPVNSCFFIPKSLPSWSIPMVFFLGRKGLPWLLELEKSLWLHPKFLFLLDLLQSHIPAPAPSWWERLEQEDFPAVTELNSNMETIATVEINIIFFLLF